MFYNINNRIPRTSPLCAQKIIERLATVMQSMDDLQKAQLCAFTEGMAMALEHSKRAS